MKNYDALKNSVGIYSIKISLQDDKFKGSFILKRKSHLKGVDILKFDINEFTNEDIKKWEKINCELKLYDESDGKKYISLSIFDKNDKWYCSKLQGDFFMNMIVSIEIIDFEEI